MRIPFRNRQSRERAAIARAPAIAPHFELGRQGEALAVEHLQRAGYPIVAANFCLPSGRGLPHAILNAEIDGLAYDCPTLCFFAVETLASHANLPPPVYVDLRYHR